MDELEEFLGDLTKRQEFLHQDREEATKSRVGELKRLQEKLDAQRVEANQSREMINKNLTSITSYRHSIKKAEETISEHHHHQAGLPISNAYHGMVIELTTGAINFTNAVGESINCALDEVDLASSIKECNKRLLQQICKDKNTMENVEMLRQNIHIAKETIHPVLEEVDNYFESSIILE